MSLVPTKAQLLLAITRTEHLVPAPRTLGRALQMLRSDDAGVHRIAELINTDSALAVDILRCANSAYFNRELRVGALDEAVQVIGFQETIRLVSLVAVRQTTHRDLASYGIPAEEFWAESLFSGLVMEEFARRTGLAEPGAAYTTGLLRFVGRLAINQALSDLGGGLFWDGVTPLADWERENVGLTHADAGALLLEKWQFPDPIITAIAHQDAAPAGPALAKNLGALLQYVAALLPAGQQGAALASGQEPDLTVPDAAPFGIALAEDDARTAIALARQNFESVRRQLYD